ncbi:Hook-associated protein 2 [Bacillus nitratireducens]|nr:Hook-associated protein 2 [Bacillus nitratireducens]
MNRRGIFVKKKMLPVLIILMMISSFFMSNLNEISAELIFKNQYIKIDGLELITDTYGNQLIDQKEFIEFIEAMDVTENSLQEVKYFYNNMNGTTSILNLGLEIYESRLKVNLINIEETNTTIKDEILNQDDFEEDSIYNGVQLRKGKPKPKPNASKKVPTKVNGGSNKADFINSHAYDRHKYDSTRKSTKNRTQYGKNVDVKKLRETTMNQPDQAWSAREDGGPWRTFYRKEFNSNISTNDTPTVHHRVIINTADSSKNTQFPLYSK